MLRPGVSFPAGVELLPGGHGLTGHAGRDLTTGAAVTIWPRGGPRSWVYDRPGVSHPRGYSYLP